MHNQAPNPALIKEVDKLLTIRKELTRDYNPDTGQLERNENADDIYVKLKQTAEADQALDLLWYIGARGHDLVAINRQAQAQPQPDETSSTSASRFAEYVEGAAEAMLIAFNEAYRDTDGGDEKTDATTAHLRQHLIPHLRGDTPDSTPDVVDIRNPQVHALVS